MFELTKKAVFSAAHYLRGYPGPCAHLHGHNWTIEVVLRAERVDPREMIIDFADLGREIDEVVEEVDHRNLNELPPFDEVNPTSENLAAYFHQELSDRLAKYGVTPYLVRVWELPDCSAAYWKD